MNGFVYSWPISILSHNIQTIHRLNEIVWRVFMNAKERLDDLQIQDVVGRRYKFCSVILAETGKRFEVPEIDSIDQFIVEDGGVKKTHDRCYIA